MDSVEGLCAAACVAASAKARMVGAIMFAGVLLTFDDDRDLLRGEE